MPRLFQNYWFRAFLQPVTYLGATMLIFLYVTLVYLLIEDRQSAERDGIRNNENLVILFERTVYHSLKSVDEKIELIRDTYRHNPSHIDLSLWAETLQHGGNLSFQFAIVGRDGYIKQASASLDPSHLYVGDRAPFTFQLHSKADELFVSEPTVLHSSNRRGLILTRRMIGKDGSFQGVVAATIDIEQLNQLYRDITLGANGFASLWGFDGVVRAAGANGHLRTDIIGQRFPHAGMFQYLKKSPSGTYWNEPGPADHVRKINGIKRLVSYRVIDGFPLIAAVGNTETDIFANANSNAKIYWAITLILSGAIIIAIGFGARREWRLNSATSSLERINAWFDSALSNMPHGLCMFDADQKLLVSNNRYATMYGLPPALIAPGTSFRSIVEGRVAGADREAAQNYLENQLQLASSQRPSQTVTSLPDGRVFMVSHQPLPDGGSVAIHQDVTEQKQAEAEISKLAHCDALTGLPNRLAFQEAVEDASRKRLQHGYAFAVHILDLDHFKDINDSLGHPIGDGLLSQMAARLESKLGDGILAARLGGDEFSILQNMQDGAADEAIALCKRLLQLVAEPYEVAGHQIFVEASIGTALAPEHGLTPNELLRRADLALYQSKGAGRNGYRIFEVEMEAQASFRQEVISELRKAIAEEQFELHYQPLISASNHKIEGYEALIRWRHPVKGILPPSTFIKVAEETGLIKSLGNWILQRACCDAMLLPNDTKIAVNLSSVQFRKNNLIDAVTHALASSNLPPNRLELEITETILLEHNEENLQILRQLQHLGIGIVLDDFGTGYSSLGYLQQFSFDKIKIDRMFVNDLDCRSECMAIIGAITGMARTLGIKTTAEGVETEEQLTFLRAAGCDQVQGFLLGRPRHIFELTSEVTSTGSDGWRENATAAKKKSA